MFEFMHKYRVPILIVIFCGLLGFGVWASIQSLFLGPSNELMGTFAMPGADERIEVWSEDYGDLFRQFARYGDGWSFFAQRFGLQEKDFGLFIWDFIMLASAAQASGIAVTDAAVERWERMTTGVEPGKDISLPDWYLDFQRKVLAVIQFRSQFIMQDPGGTPFTDLLTEYQRTYSTISAKVILLDKREPDSFVLDLGKEADKAKLKEWFEKNAWVATTNKKAESVDVEVVYVRLRDQSIDAFKKAFDENWAGLAQDMKVTEEDLQARYKAATFPYQQLAHDEMDKAGVEHTHGQDDQDADYDYLKKTGHLEREIKVARLMRILHDQVKESPATLEGVATDQYKFSAVSLPDAERSGLAEQPDFGSLRLSAMVWVNGVARLPEEGAEPKEGDYKLGDLLSDPGQPAGGLEVDVFDEPGTMIGLVRVTAHKEERVPEFDEIVVKAKQEWQTAQAREDLMKRTGEFQESVDAWALDELMSDDVSSKPWSRWTWLSDSALKVVASERHRNTKIAEAIKTAKLDPANPEHEQQIERVEDDQQRVLKVELADDMDPLMARGFEEIADRMKLVPFDFGPVNKATGLLPQYPEGLSRQERANRLMRSKSVMNGLSFLKIGNISTMPVDAAGLSVLALVTKRTDPEASELLVYPDRVREIAARRRVQPDRNWNYKVLKAESFFNLDAPKTDQGIVEAEEADRERALKRMERQRKRNEARQAAMRRALEQKQQKEGAADPDNPDVGDQDKTADPDKAAAPDKAKKPGAVDKAKKPGAADKAKKPGAADKAKKPGAADKAKKPGAADKAKKPGAADKAKKPGAADKAKKPGAADK